MSDHARKSRKSLRAHVISPLPLAAGLGLLCAGVDNADAAVFNFEVPIASAGQYQYATLPGTHTPGTVLPNSGETLIFPTANSPLSANYGMVQFNSAGNILYDLTSCPPTNGGES